MPRRRFLATMAAAALGTPLARRGGSVLARRDPTDLFRLGVASGDPLPDRVVLWTRLAPRPLEGGGMPSRDVEVDWEVADDERFTRVVRRGAAVARPGAAHAVHVDVEGLRPGTEYHYRFRVGTETSPVGRTRTAPTGRARRLRFAMASCQHWEEGYYIAHRNIAAEDVDFVLFLGDYIYETAPRVGAVRTHEGTGETVTLADYRNRYAHYRTDPDLAAAHAAAPWVVTPDDHEVDNNWAADHAQLNDIQTHAQFQRRRAAALRAYYEHMPLRAPSRFHRRLRFGDLATLHVLDTRQYRSPQPRNLAEADDPRRTMTGAAQERWLLDGLTGSDTRWNLVANQTMMASTTTPAATNGPCIDNWDGYRAQRRRLLERFADVRNPVVLSGDQHSTWVCDLKPDFDVEGSPVVGTEITGTSITSGGDPSTGEFHRTYEALITDHPHWKYLDNRRGYIHCDVTPDAVRADLRVADSVLNPTGLVYTAAHFTIESDRPGAHLDEL